MSVVGVLRGEEHEGARRTLIPTWAQTDRWTGDTRGWGSPHLSGFLPPPPTAPLSLARCGPSSHLFFFAPPYSELYPFLWDCMLPSLSGSLTPCPTSGCSPIFPLPPFSGPLSPSLWVSSPLYL